MSDLMVLNDFWIIYKDKLENKIDRKLGEKECKALKNAFYSGFSACIYILNAFSKDNISQNLINETIGMMINECFEVCGVLEENRVDILH